jgi:uncharacterized protein YaeQ
MAQGATIYVFAIELADADRAVYASLDLRVARHPSETADHLLARVIAYCLEYTEGIAFSRGLSDADEPSILVRDLVGSLRSWIDIGLPEAARLHRAAKAAPRVVVYCHKDPGQLITRLSGERIHRSQHLELYALDREWLGSLERLLDRRMKFSLTVSAQHLYLSMGAQTFDSVLAPIELGGTTASDGSL